MAIALDTTSIFNSPGFGGVTPYGTTHTTSGTNRLLVVAVFDGSAIVTGVKYAGVSLTKLGASVGSLLYWYLVAPTLGTNSIAVTMSANGNAQGYSAATFTGVNQVSPIETSTSSTNQTVATSTTGAATQSVLMTTGTALVAAFNQGSGFTPTPGTGQVNGGIANTSANADTMYLTWKLGLTAGTNSVSETVTTTPTTLETFNILAASIVSAQVSTLTGISTTTGLTSITF